MKALLALTALVLVGCSAEVTRFDIEKAETVCGDKSKILFIGVVERSKFVKCYQFEELKEIK